MAVMVDPRVQVMQVHAGPHEAIIVNRSELLIGKKKNNPFRLENLLQGLGDPRPHFGESQVAIRHMDDVEDFV